MHHETSKWTISDALKVNFTDPTTTMPRIPYNFPVAQANKTVWQWDSWALRDIHGNTVTINGQYVLFALVAPRKEGEELQPSWVNRNDFSYIGWFTSPTGNGTDWEFRGAVIKEGANSRAWQWSGCAVLRHGKEYEGLIDLFYTSVGPEPESVAAHTSGSIVAKEDGTLELKGFDTCIDMFEADGIHYANHATDPYWDFRDPHVFLNPDDGEIYALFEGNAAGVRGTLRVGDAETGVLPPGVFVGADAQYGASAIGIARLKGGLNRLGSYRQGKFGRKQWEMLPPLLTSVGVNDQTERPHVVFQDDMTYLFTISHRSTYTGSSKGPDGVYGFVSAEGLFGPYEPLNSSGLVLGNPVDAPLETYSHFVDTEGYVQSFINYVPPEGKQLVDPYLASPSGPEEYRIGGTLAPTVRLVLDGRRTFLSEVHNYGQIFSVRDVELKEYNPTGWKMLLTLA